MAVYREGYNFIEIVGNNSYKVFADAADVGMPIRKNDSIWNQLKHVIATYGIGNREETKYGVSKVIELMDEWAVSDRRKTEKEATEKWKITYHTIKQWKLKPYLNPIFKDADGFITVEKIK